MSFFPETEDGHLKETPTEPKLYTPPRYYSKKNEETRLSEINNLGRKAVTEDFSDSPHLNK